MSIRCGPDDNTYQGLYKLFSICTLLKKVNVGGHNHYRHQKLCRALDALAGCPNLEDLRAPVGNKTLRNILSGVKGIRKLNLSRPREEIHDEALFLLKGNSPFLREFRFYPWSKKMDGITDEGLEHLSFCSQLQKLRIHGNI